jgi:dTDP-4-amino-4,6-dideoxygalactose transaminase
LAKIRQFHAPRLHCQRLHYDARISTNGLPNRRILPSIVPTSFIKFKNQKIRDYILKKLSNKGIETAFHFQPLHASPMGKKIGYQKRDLQLTNDIAASMLRLPIYPGLSAANLNYIIAELRNIFLEIKQAGV